MMEGVVATNADGRITLVNPAGTILLGVTEDQAVGSPLAEWDPDWPVLSRVPDHR